MFTMDHFGVRSADTFTRRHIDNNSVRCQKMESLFEKKEIPNSQVYQLGRLAIPLQQSKIHYEQRARSPPKQPICIKSPKRIRRQGLTVVSSPRAKQQELFFAKQKASVNTNHFCTSQSPIKQSMYMEKISHENQSQELFRQRRPKQINIQQFQYHHYGLQSPKTTVQKMTQYIQHQRQYIPPISPQSPPKEHPSQKRIETTGLSHHRIQNYQPLKNDSKHIVKLETIRTNSSQKKYLNYPQMRLENYYPPNGNTSKAKIQQLKFQPSKEQPFFNEYHTQPQKSPSPAVRNNITSCKPVIQIQQNCAYFQTQVTGQNMNLKPKILSQNSIPQNQCKNELKILSAQQIQPPPPKRELQSDITKTQTQFNSATSSITSKSTPKVSLESRARISHSIFVPDIESAPSKKPLFHEQGFNQTRNEQFRSPFEMKQVKLTVSRINDN